MLNPADRTTSSGYVVGAGGLMWLLSVVLIVIPIGVLVVMSILEGPSEVASAFLFLAWPAAFGVWLLWSASRRAVVSDTTITFRSIFRSTSIPWTEVVLVKHSETWLVIEDSYGGSHRIGPYPHKAYDFERDIRDRRARGLSHASVWSGRHPFNRELDEHPEVPFDQEVVSPPLTVLQGVGVVLMIILAVAAALAFDSYVEPAAVRYLIRVGVPSAMVDFVLAYAFLQLAFLVSFAYSWLRESGPSRNAVKLWILVSVFLAAFLVFWAVLDTAWRRTGLSDGWEALVFIAGTIAIFVAMERAQKALGITLPIRKRA
jgi:hypothetical protein